MDTAYIPMRRGFVYLAVMLDWASRRVLVWRLSISAAADAAVETLEEAIAKHGVQEIVNTDQGSQFTDGTSSMCCDPMPCASAWTARTAGATTCSSNGCERRSTTTAPISTPTRPPPRTRRNWRSSSTSTTAASRIPVLTGRYLVTCAPTSRRYDWRLNLQGNHLRNWKNHPTVSSTSVGEERSFLSCVRRAATLSTDCRYFQSHSRPVVSHQTQFAR